MSGVSSKSEVVLVRLGTDEFNRLKEIADREGVPVSAVIRRIVQVPATAGGTIIRAASRNLTPESIVGGYSTDRVAAEMKGVPYVPNYRYSAPTLANGSRWLDPCRKGRRCASRVDGHDRCRSVGRSDPSQNGDVTEP